MGGPLGHRRPGDDRTGGRHERGAPARGDTAGRATRDPDSDKGAVEGDRPDEPQFYNPNLDETGQPTRPEAVGEDAIGADVDESQG